jgi:hypothetical protein
MRLRKPHNFSYSKEEFYDARNHPVITHFTGNFYVRRRPWIENSDHPHKGAYMKFRALSPWKDSPLGEDMRSYKAKKYTELCHYLPRPVMIEMVAVLYNVIRPIAFKKKIKDERES